MSEHEKISPTKAVSLSLQHIAEMLDNALNDAAGEPTGFALVVFTPERAQYVSNCDREDVVKGLKELLELWEHGMPDVPAHKALWRLLIN